MQQTTTSNIYILCNNDDSAQKYKIGRAVDVEERAQAISREGYNDRHSFCKPGEDVGVVESTPTHNAVAAEERTFEILGMTKEHLEKYGEVSFRPLEEIRSAIARAIREKG